MIVAAQETEKFRFYRPEREFFGGYGRKSVFHVVAHLHAEECAGYAVSTLSVNACIEYLSESIYILFHNSILIA